MCEFVCLFVCLSVNFALIEMLTHLKTRLEIERVWDGQTLIFGSAKNGPKMNCPKVSNISRSSKTSKMASKIALFGANSKQNKARFTKMLWDKVFIFMNYTRFKGIKREILLLLVLYLEKWIENWYQKYLYYKFLF